MRKEYPLHHPNLVFVPGFEEHAYVGIHTQNIVVFDVHKFTKIVYLVYQTNFK